MSFAFGNMTQLLGREKKKKKKHPCKQGCVFQGVAVLSEMQTWVQEGWLKDGSAVRVTSGVRDGNSTHFL